MPALLEAPRDDAPWCSSHPGFLAGGNRPHAMPIAHASRLYFCIPKHSDAIHWPPGKSISVRITGRQTQRVYRRLTGVSTAAAAPSTSDMAALAGDLAVPTTAI